MIRDRRYLVSYTDWYDWIPYRSWSAHRLRERARHVRRQGGAIVIVTREILDRWRRGAYASPQQLQQAQIPS